MKLYKYLLFILFTFFLLVFFLELSSFSDGPPASRTAAPGELNCSNGYCHNSFSLNSGPGMASLSGDIFENGFRAGQTYTITAKVKQDGQQRFGFMVMAYDSLGQISGGSVSLAEPDRTQLTENQAGDRIYVSHDPANITSDSSEWTFNWTAPNTESTPEEISFYAAFVAANNNNNSAGDYVYAIRADAGLDSSWATPIAHELSNQDVKISFDHVSGRIQVESQQSSGKMTRIEVVSLNGQLSYKNEAYLLPYIPYNVHTKAWAGGIYILKIQQADKFRAEKFRLIR
ncbi:MAG: choice-of-anchor V domain-containing protein [Bacteroidia bacterium]|nr:choice-of-anchor V domain-containing protein [Bacteroidia bacterium]